jgi:RNA polymerase sigma-70 factor (ECF subfamily)
VDDRNGIIKRILTGDERAFAQLVEKYKRLVAHIVFKMIPDATEREDVCQEVFVKVYKSLKSYRGEAKLSTWIGRITHNRCVDYLSKKNLPVADEEFEETARRIPDDTPSPDDKAEKGELAVMVQREIDQLPVRYGMILALYHLHDMSYNEISGVLKIPEGTVKSYLFRGRKILKERLLERYNKEEFRL